MNTNWIVDKRMQYDFLFGSVRRRKRFDKWLKKDDIDELTVKVIMEYYQVGHKRAIEYLSMMTEEQKQTLRSGYGGS